MLDLLQRLASWSWRPTAGIQRRGRAQDGGLLAPIVPCAGRGARDGVTLQDALITAEAHQSVTLAQPQSSWRGSRSRLEMA